MAQNETRFKMRAPLQIQHTLREVNSLFKAGEIALRDRKILSLGLGKIHLSSLRRMAEAYFKNFKLDSVHRTVIMDGRNFRLSSSQWKIVRVLFDQHLISNGNIDGLPLEVILKKAKIKMAKNSKMQNYFRVTKGGRPPYQRLIEQTRGRKWRLRITETFGFENVGLG